MGTAQEFSLIGSIVSDRQRTILEATVLSFILDNTEKFFIQSFWIVADFFISTG